MQWMSRVADSMTQNSACGLYTWGANCTGYVRPGVHDTLGPSGTARART